MERRFGWDTHGLPVEYEIDKTLGITGPQDVEKMGIKAYNDECRKIVMRYAGEKCVVFSFIQSRCDSSDGFEPSFTNGTTFTAL